jgi:hypothetical protein
VANLRDRGFGIGRIAQRQRFPSTAMSALATAPVSTQNTLPG